MAKRREVNKDTHRKRPETKMPTQTAGGVASSKYLLPILLFFVCFGAYVSNGDFLPGGDQEGNMLLSVNMLKRLRLFAQPARCARCFHSGYGRSPARIHRDRSPFRSIYGIARVNDLYEKGPTKGGEYRTTFWPKPRAPRCMSTPSALDRPLLDYRSMLFSIFSSILNPTTTGGGTAEP